MSPPLYFDNNSGTRIDPRVIEAVVAELESECGNPSSMHSHGQQARLLIDNARAGIARFLGVKPNEIIFNSGGTEGALFFIEGILSRLESGHIITSSVEHACVYQSLIEKEKSGFQVTYLNPGLWGAPHPNQVLEAIQPDTKLIILMSANNETGVKTDWEAIAAIAHEKNIPFIVDGVALLGKERFTIPKGVAGMFFSGHKIYAPKGIGFCFSRLDLKLAPLLIGGNQEFRKRAGTENLAGIAGLFKAISILDKEQESVTNHLFHLRHQFEELVKKNFDVTVHGTGPRISNTSNVAFNQVDGETLLLKLNFAGVSVSHGSACSSGGLEPSRVLVKMGVPLCQVRSSLRFSFGRFNTIEEIFQLISLIKKVLN